MTTIYIDIEPHPKGNSKRVLRVPRKGARKLGGRFREEDTRLVFKGTDAEARHEVALRALAREAAPFSWPLPGPVVLDLIVVLGLPEPSSAYPPSWRLRALRGEVRPGTGDRTTGGREVADRGNYLKMVEDALEGVAFLNDAETVAGELHKVWAPPGLSPGYVIRVAPWSP